MRIDALCSYFVRLRALVSLTTLLLTVAAADAAVAQEQSTETKRQFLPTKTYSERLATDEVATLTNTKLSVAAKDHMQSLRTLDASGVVRLAFFFDFLDHADAGIAANAHLEFALAAHEDFARFCERLSATQIRQRVTKPDIPDYQTQLYLAMLAECGSESDGDWLEPRLAAHTGRRTLAPMLAAYLKLKGEPGLELVNREYLAKQGPEHIANAYAGLLAIGALRGDRSISKEKLIESVRLVLENPLMQDLAIYQLGHHEDWSSVDRVVETFKSPGIEWARMSAVQYLRLCPTNEAAIALTEIEQLDPSLVKRARQFYPESWIAERRQQSKPVRSIRPTGRGGSGC